MNEEVLDAILSRETAPKTIKNLEIRDEEKTATYDIAVISGLGLVLISVSPNKTTSQQKEMTERYIRRNFYVRTFFLDIDASRTSDNAANPPQFLRQLADWERQYGCPYTKKDIIHIYYTMLRITGDPTGEYEKHALRLTEKAKAEKVIRPVIKWLIFLFVFCFLILIYNNSSVLQNVIYSAKGAIHSIIKQIMSTVNLWLSAFSG